MDLRMGSLERIDEKKTILDVQKIIMHPDYDYKTLQNDAALLKLVSPVTLTTTIRKVCLPDDIIKYPDIDDVEDMDEFYSPKRWTVVTGWGYENKLGANKQNINIQFADTLKQIQMQIQENSTCTENLADKQLYTQAMYCAGDGGKRDACKGDSGGPSMVQLKVSEYTNRVFQVGVVSWGDGCFQANKYGFYTRLSEFVGWIRDTMEKNRG